MMFISKNKIIQEFQRVYKIEGPFYQKDWDKLMFCNQQTVRNKFGSFSKLSKLAKRRFKKYPSSKGKTIEELFGNEKAEKIRKKTKKSKEHIIIQKEKILREFQTKCNTYGLFLKTEWNDIMFCHINTARQKFGSLDNLANVANKQFKKPKMEKFSKKKIIEEFQNFYDRHGTFFKTEWNKLMSCSSATVRNKFGGLDELAEVARRRFKQSQHAVGKNETFILDNIQKEKNIRLERQKLVQINNKRYYIDGYDVINNIMYEVDESFHNQQKVQDLIREKHIKEKLGCDVVRINERQFIQNINQTTLEDVGVIND